MSAELTTTMPQRALTKQECQVEIMRIEKENNYLQSEIGQMEKKFELVQRQANVLANSQMVPDFYKFDLANCIIAINMAEQFKVNVYCLMQNMYLVQGTPAFSAKFIIAQINDSNKFTPLQYEWRDCDPNSPDYGVRAVAYRKDDTNREFKLEGAWITNAMIKAEGWDKNPKWKTPIRNQMFCYRASAFWQRVYAPELTMGIISREELEDVNYGQPVNPAIKGQKSALNAIAESAVMEMMKDGAKQAQDADEQKSTNAEQTLNKNEQNENVEQQNELVLE